MLTAYYRSTEFLKLGVPPHDTLHWLCKCHLALCASPVRTGAQGAGADADPMATAVLSLTQESCVFHQHP